MSDPEVIGATPDQPMLTVSDPVEIGPRRWRIALVGEIDMSNADWLTSACAGIVDQSGVTLEIDLAALTYIDSSGIGAVVRLLRSLESHGGSVRILNPSGIVRRVLDLSGLLPLFDEHSS